MEPLICIIRAEDLTKETLEALRKLSSANIIQVVCLNGYVGVARYTTNIGAIKKALKKRTCDE